MMGPLSHIVDIGSVEPFDTDEIAFPDEESEEHTLIDLLRRTLIAQLDGVLSYSRGRRAFYFTANTDIIKRVYAYRSLKSYTSAHVVKQYEKDGKVVYVRHHAFEPRFWRIGNQWYLSITPDVRIHLGRLPSRPLCCEPSGWQEEARAPGGIDRSVRDVASPAHWRDASGDRAAARARACFRTASSLPKP